MPNEDTTSEELICWCVRKFIDYWKTVPLFPTRSS